MARSVCRARSFQRSPASAARDLTSRNRADSHHFPSALVDRDDRARRRRHQFPTFKINFNFFAERCARFRQRARRRLSAQVRAGRCNRTPDSRARARATGFGDTRTPTPSVRPAPAGYRREPATRSSAVPARTRRPAAAHRSVLRAPPKMPSRCRLRSVRRAARVRVPSPETVARSAVDENGSAPIA